MPSLTAFMTTTIPLTLRFAGCQAACGAGEDRRDTYSVMTEQKIVHVHHLQ